MRKKKLLSLIMSVALLFGSAAALPEGAFETSPTITASAVTTTFSGAGDGSETNPYQITSANELLQISNNPNSCYVLNNDIDLSKHNGGLWNGICDEKNPFRGELDGQSHTISNLNFDRINSGLFNATSGCSIKNLVLKTSSINISYSGGTVYDSEDDYYDYDESLDDYSSNAGGYYVGSLIGIDLMNNESENTTIDNCRIEADLSIKSTCRGSKSHYVGGLIGCVQGQYEKELHFSNCTIDGSVLFYSVPTYGGAVNYIGGLVGKTNESLVCEDISVSSNILSSVNSTAIYTYAGGIVGSAGHFEAFNCSVNGDIVADCNDESWIDDKSHWSYSGGLSGKVSDFYVYNSHVSGKIYNNSDYGTGHAGGLFGECNSGDVTSGSYNGNISNYCIRICADAYAGGLCGEAQSITIDEFKTNNTIYNCGYDSGDIYSGGIVGRCDDFSINNYVVTTKLTPCAFDGAGASSYAGGLVGYAWDAYLEEKPVDIHIDNSSKGIHNYNSTDLNNNYVGYAFNYSNNTSLNTKTELSFGDVNCVVGKDVWFFGNYTAQFASKIDSELSSIDLSYDNSAMKITDVSYSKSGKNGAVISGTINAKKIGNYEVYVSLANSIVDTQSFSVNIEPELVLPGSSTGTKYNNYSNLTLSFGKSRYDQSKEVKLNVSIDESNKDYLESFLDSIEIKREKTDDLVMGYSEYKTSYKISDDGKSAEYKIKITTQDLTIKDYLIIGTPAQSKKICVSRESTTLGRRENYTAADDYIIGEVEKYCSDDGDLSFLNDVNSGDYTYEARQEILLSYFSNYGLNSEKEGIKYISEASAYRRHYNYLINHNNFCASIYSQEIDDDPVKKAALISAGLIFNNELFEPFNFSPDLINHNPTAKKYKEMLRSFISGNTQEVKPLKMADTIGKYLSKALKIYTTTDESYFDALLDEILKCKDPTKLKGLQTKFSNYIVKAAKEGKVSLRCPAVSKALGYASSTISFASATANDIMALINLEDEVRLYQQNIYFLQTIADSDIASYDMKLAAMSLLDDINNGYKKLTDDILVKTFKFSKDTFETVVDSDMWKSIFGDCIGGDISGALKTYKLAVFISNVIVNTGDFVKQTSYTKGYAEIADLFKTILENDKWNFNRDMSKENAWKFFEDYSILWDLRYSGESQYLKASKLKILGWDNVPINNYGYKEKVVKEIQKVLENAKFFVSSSITIPSSVQYRQKAVVRCPVDVYVYNTSGTLIAKLKDGSESDITNKYGRFAVVYNPCTNEYDKVIANLTDSTLNIKMIAVDDGFVNYNLMYKDKSGNNRALSFDNEEIKKDDTISIKTNSETYSVDCGGNGTTNKTKKLINNSKYIKVNGISVSTDKLCLHKGDNKVINVDVTPSNASYKLVNWTTDDELVAEVKNGKIIAKSVGKTKVTATAVDNQEKSVSIIVTVSDAKHNWGKWKTARAATCTAAGSKTRTCTVCGEMETSAIAKFGHSYKVTVIKPTCTAKGYTLHKCSRCGDSYKDTYTNTVAHKFSAWTTTKKATCTTDGAQTRKCSVCGKTESRTIKAPGHKFTNWTTTKKATCTTAGSKKRVCEDCGEIEKATIKKLGHSYKATVVKPTCTAKGYTLHKCTKCGASYKDKYTNTIAHKFSAWKTAKAATPVSTGTQTRTCSVCRKTQTKPLPKINLRLSGHNRYDTSISIANQFKKLNGNSKFKNVIIASGTGFADALSSAYLAKVKDAPILIVAPGVEDKIVNYVKANTLSTATIYIIGGDAAVPKTIDAKLKQSFKNVKRLWGKNRFGTNLAVLKEAGTGEDHIIIGNGLGYADALSASATGKPILLTSGKGLTTAQKAYLKKAGYKAATLIGESDVVSKGVESDVRKLVKNTDRQGGRTRFETSVLIAKKFFKNPKTVSLAYGLNYPDGLCGAPLSMKYGCPLILASDAVTDPVKEYAKNNGVTSAVIYGGSDILADKTVKTILGK